MLQVHGLIMREKKLLTKCQKKRRSKTAGFRMAEGRLIFWLTGFIDKVVDFLDILKALKCFGIPPNFQFFKFLTFFWPSKLVTNSCNSYSLADRSCARWDIVASSSAPRVPERRRSGVPWRCRWSPWARTADGNRWILKPSPQMSSMASSSRPGGLAVFVFWCLLMSLGSALGFEFGSG